MRFTPFALAVAAHGALAIPSKPSGRGFGCGAPEPHAEHIKISQKFAQQEAEFAASGNFSIQAVTNVDVYFHVVASSTALSGGYVTVSTSTPFSDMTQQLTMTGQDAQLTAQLNAMNTAYAPYGFQFTLKGTDRTVNANWAVDGNGYEMTMKKALRKGTYRSLNIYFLKDMGDNLGYCYFPESVTSGSTAYIRDGCTVLYSTVPGGSATNFNLGHTVTHEVGHWFGLYHTFQGGCTGSGDSVSDTPAQASASSGCPVGRDSCPSQAGVDPIHNYMDYSYE